ncbi:DoxX family protein [Pontiella sp.]|uniref:DoxX family protein n=1 Tax=Pontiella sp. TaxID=2837462 RepID=UPI0035676C3D
MNVYLNLLGRFFLVLIFLMSAVGNKIPHFSGTTEYMRAEGVPAPALLLAGAILFLIAGGLSVLVGYKARIGAALLLVFLMLATYWFHDFWTFEDAQARQMQTINFMKNLALMGAMLMIIARGAGAGSLDRRFSKLD